MLVNEIAQWVVLAFIGVFVLGLTRQLGKFLVSPKDQLVMDTGPALGKRVPDALIADGGARRVRALMAERQVDWATVLVVGEECVSCKPLLDRLEQDGAPEGAPVIAIARRASPDFRARLERVADVVTVDADVVEATGLRATPFGLIVDDQLAVAHKELAWSLDDLVAAWRRASEPPAPAASAERNGSVRLQTTYSGGERR